MTNPAQLSKLVRSLGLLMVVGLLLRLLLINQGFWRDEVECYYYGMGKTAYDVMARAIPIDFNPPLYFLGMHYWMQFVGLDEWIMKIPSLIGGLVLIPVVYMLGKQIGGHAIGCVTALLATFSQQAVFYSTQCRPYSWVTVIACLSVLFYCRIIDGDISKRTQVILGGTFLLGLYFHYTFVFIFIALCVSTLILCINRQAVLGIYNWALIFLVPALCFLPWISIMLKHIHTGFHWTHMPEWYQWPAVCLLNIMEASPVSYWTLPQTIYSTALFMLVPLAFYQYGKQKDFFRSTGLDNIAKLIPLLCCLAVPAILEGYATPQTDRYMVPFGPFEWILFLICLLSWSNYFDSYYSQYSETRQRWFFIKKLVVLIVFVLFCFNVQDVLSRSGHLSGARQFCEDIRAGKFNHAVFLFIPDMTISEIDYQLRHYHLIANPDQVLSDMHGCVRWDDKNPVDLSTYQAVLSDQNFMSKLKKKIDTLSASKYAKIVMVEESYMPDTKAMPCKQIAKVVENCLDAKYKSDDLIIYPGWMESYIVRVYSTQKLP